MTPSGDGWARLKLYIQAGLYRIEARGFAEIFEKGKDGYAQVTCHLPASTQCISWLIEGSKLFPTLKSNEAADGALLLQRADGTWEAHVMECKRSVDESEWSKAKRQIGWSVVRLLSLAGVLGIRISQLVCYIAYREERLSARYSPNPGLHKLPLGEVTDPTVQEEVELLEDLPDWPSTEITLNGIDGSVPYRKVLLDPATGVGETTLLTT